MKDYNGIDEDVLKDVLEDFEKRKGEHEYSNSRGETAEVIYRFIKVIITATKPDDWKVGQCTPVKGTILLPDKLVPILQEVQKFGIPLDVLEDFYATLMLVLAHAGLTLFATVYREELGI